MFVSLVMIVDVQFDFNNGGFFIRSLLYRGSVRFDFKRFTFFLPFSNLLLTVLQPLPSLLIPTFKFPQFS